MGVICCILFIYYNTILISFFLIVCLLHYVVCSCSCFLQRACWGREDRHAETVRVMLQNGVPHDLASRDGKTCEQMTRNEGTLAALLEAREGSSYEL